MAQNLTEKMPGCVGGHGQKVRAIARLLVAFAMAAIYARAADQLTLNAASGKADAGNQIIPAVTVSSTYLLSPYDVIDVSVYDEDDLHTRAKLGADGTVLLPLIGSVKLEGKTVSAASEVIRKSYADGGYVKDPHVLLTVLEYRKRTFSILGLVARPGIYELPEGAHVSIIDAVLIAGGFTRTADQNAVIVKRTTKGKAQILKVNARLMVDKADIAPFEIKAGDTIKVNESWW